MLSHLKLFQNVGDTGSLELGASFLHARTSGDRDAAGYVLGADATYQWHGPAHPDFPSLLLQGEFFWSNSDFDDPVMGSIRDEGYRGRNLFARCYFRPRFSVHAYDNVAGRRVAYQ